MTTVTDRFSHNGWFGYIESAHRDNEPHIRWVAGPMDDFDEGYYTFPDNQELFDEIASNINEAIEEENTMRVLSGQMKLSTITLDRKFHGMEGWGLVVDFTDEYDDNIDLLATFHWLKKQIEEEADFTIEMYDMLLEWVPETEECAA